MTVTCLKLAGEWDFTRRQELQAVLRPAESVDEVLLDFSAVTNIDGSVMGTLMRLRRRMMAEGCRGRIRIVEASRHIVHLFTICDLDQLFGLGAPTIDDAAASGLVGPATRGSAFPRA